MPSDWAWPPSRLRVTSFGVCPRLVRGDQCLSGHISGGGFSVGNGYGSMSNCLIFGNSVPAVDSGSAGYMDGGSVALVNCTVADHPNHGLYRYFGAMTLRNCIVWGNGDDLRGITDLWYSSIEDGDNDGTNGCVRLNPEFVDKRYYHLKSREGHVTGAYFRGGTWSTSAIHSPLIDLGDPTSPCSREPPPNGGRVNMGAYGNTATASKSRPLGTMCLLH